MAKRSLGGILLFGCLAAAGVLTVLASYQQVSVEDIVKRCEVIALGRVTATDPEGTEVGPMKQLFTRHTFKVEAYYKGSGPEEINLYTHGGFWTDEKGEQHWVSVTNVAGVKQGEELLLFLKAIPEGYWIPASDGARYDVQTDPETGERTVKLRFRKRKYMKNEALKGFDRLAEAEEHAAAAASGELRFGKFQTEKIPVGELGARLQQVIEGEALPVP